MERRSVSEPSSRVIRTPTYVGPDRRRDGRPRRRRDNLEGQSAEWTDQINLSAEEIDALLRD